MVNRVYVVEKFVYKVMCEKYDPTIEEIKSIGEILGQPSKKLNVVLDRYKQVFSRYVEKRCVKIDSMSICIYTWNQKIPFKIFPLSMHLTGTILLFKDEEPKEVLAYPIPKALSYAKSSEVSEDRYGDIIPREVTERIDGWQLTAYYNPILNRWIFATRYVLHNMYFDRGKLRIENIDDIVNPFVYVADKIAQEEKLYNLLDRFREWTFTLVMQGPEPAITRPPYPLGNDYHRYKLYMIMARDKNGRLYSWSETNAMINYRTPIHVQPKPLSQLYKEIVKKLDTRSYIAYIDTHDLENPFLIELESEVYPEAMNIKYLYDAKSAALLIAEGIQDLTQLIDLDQAKMLQEMMQLIERLKNILSSIDKNKAYSAGWEIVRTLNEFTENVELRVDEISKTISEKNIGRILKKTLSLLLEGRSLASKTTIDTLNLFIEKLEQKLKQYSDMHKTIYNNKSINH